jgi:hypothetical protein
MPYTTPPGAQYDSGDYPATLAHRPRALRLSHGCARSNHEIARSAGPPASASASPTVGRACGTNLALVRDRDGPPERRPARPRRPWYAVEPDGNVRRAIGDPRAARATRRSVAQIVATSSARDAEAVSVARASIHYRVAVALSLRNYSNKFSVTDTGRDGGGGPPRRGQLRRLAGHRSRSLPPTSTLRDGAVCAGSAVGAWLRRALPHRVRDVLGLPPR